METEPRYYIDLTLSERRCLLQMLEEATRVTGDAASASKAVGETLAALDVRVCYTDISLLLNKTMGILDSETWATLRQAYPNFTSAS